MVVTPHSFGGQGKGLIIAADIVLRTEMFKIDTLQPTLTGDEVLASVLTSACCCGPTGKTRNHAANLPTHQQMVDDNRRTYVPTLPTSAESVPPRRVGSAWGICRLFADGRRKWGGARKRVRDSRSRNPSLGLVQRMDNERNQRRRVSARRPQPM